MTLGWRRTALVLAMCGAAAAAAVGCATKYRAEDFTRGYSIFQIDPTTYRVSLHPTAYGTSGAGRDYLLYRCAELTLNAGYDYFLILPPEARPLREGDSTDAGSPTEDRGTAARARSRLNPASPMDPSRAPRTGDSMVIRLLPGGKADHPTALAARDVLQSLRSRMQ